MSVQDVSIFLSLGPNETGTVNVTGIKAGDKIVAIRAVHSDQATIGDDLSSYFSSTVTTDGELSQISPLQSQNTLLIVLARGV